MEDTSHQLQDPRTKLADEILDQKKELKYYLCIKIACIIVIEQIPIGIAHLFESNQNYSLCLTDKIMGTMTFQQWFNVDGSITVIAALFCGILLLLKRTQVQVPVEKQKCGIRMRNLKQLFFVLIAIVLIIDVIKLVFSSFLTFRWLLVMDKNRCDFIMKFSFWFESMTTLVCYLVILIRPFYFFFSLKKSFKINELSRIDEPRQLAQIKEEEK